MHDLGQLDEHETGMSCNMAIAFVRRELEAAHVEDPAAEARRLVAGAAGLDPARLIIEPEKILTTSECDVVRCWAERRCGGESLARIRGWQEFYGREFLISPATLEPRSDSETLVEAVLDWVDVRQGRSHAWRIIDVGTGTGCLLLTLLAELPHSLGLGTDISAQAVDTAKMNAERLSLATRAMWQSTNYLDNVDGTFDILISNPPYILRSEIASLRVEVSGHDPWQALDGGDDGLDAYRAIAKAAHNVVPCGCLVFETAGEDDERVARTVIDAWQGPVLAPPRVWRDLRGVRRCVALETLC